jgi:pimeloyl-ACP methyl ester carboxylesterase
VEPLFFGESARPLYGVYHPPSINQYRDEGVLLCYPAGQEYLRLHRAYRQLATLLADKGFHVLRFDFSGTGDSFGNNEDMTYSAWLKDVEHAAEELQAMSGVNNLYIVGARIGSIVAAGAAKSIKARKIVLWEPYAKSEAIFEDIITRINNDPDDSNYLDQSGGFHFNGFHFPESFISSFSGSGIAEIDLSGQPASVLLISSEDSEKLASIESVLKTQGIDTTKKQVDCVSDWNELDEMGGLFLPQQTLTVIADWIEGVK